jgi:6-phosphogluconolactonase
MYVYIGTYSVRGSEGIYVYELDTHSGRLRDTGQRAAAHNASFLALHPNGRALYAVSEVDGAQEMPNSERGGMRAFGIDEATGALSLINAQPLHGSAACHISVDKSGSLVAVANYSSGCVASLPINADCSLGEAGERFQHHGSSVNSERQQGPHAHSVTFDSSNRFALACDLGLDKILVYAVDAAGQRLAPSQVLAASVKPGAGPRHFVFHPSNRFGYVMNELDSTITAFAFDDSSGALHEIQTLSTLPPGFSGGSSGADIHIAPSGRFLYGSNRGHDSLAAYAIDAETGMLTPIGHTPTHGKTPRNFGIEPSGAFVLAANQDSDSVVVLRVDTESGLPAEVVDTVAVPSPVCVRFGVS